MIDITKIVALSETIEIDDVESDGTTPYGVWKVAKEIFETVGLEFNYAPQTFYNFAKSGKINGVKLSKQRFSDDEVEIFVAKLIASNK